MRYMVERLAAVDMQPVGGRCTSMNKIHQRTCMLHMHEQKNHTHSCKMQYIYATQQLLYAHTQAEFCMQTSVYMSSKLFLECHTQCLWLGFP